MSALPVTLAPLSPMSFDALCDALAARRIILSSRGARAGRLDYEAPAGAMTPDILAALALHKRALLAALTEKPASVRKVSVCAWGAPHFQAWRYHAGERRLVCAICYPSAWDRRQGSPDRGASSPTPAPIETPEDTPAVAPVELAPMPSPRVGPDRRPSGKGAPDRLAVLDASGGTVCVWVERPDGRGIECAALAPEDLPTPGACHAGALLALAARLQVAHVWIHPTWAALAGLPGRDAMPKWREERRAGVSLPFISDALADGWDIQPAGLAPWMVGLRRGVWGRYALVYPAWDFSAPWRDAPDGATLLQALVRYRAALGGHAYRHTPAVTGVGLLKRLHSGHTALDLAASVTPGDFPPPAREPGTEWDMSYERPLTAEEATRAQVSACDKNAMYLGAASSLWVGMGKAEHLTVERERDELAGLVALAATKDRLPGYWLASIEYTPPTGLPSPFTPDGVPDGTPRWLTTPTVELALKVGARVDVREAWVWRERHRPLEPFYQVMRDAREALMMEAPHNHAAALALAVVKATYRATLGGRFDASWLRASGEREDLYRPDWRHAVIAQARANFYRAALAVYKASGLAPIRAYTDCWYYVTDAPDGDALAACPAPLKLADGLAGWKVKVTPLADYLAQTPARTGARRRSDILAEIARKREARATAEGK